jgi:hypothetical protein
MIEGLPLYINLVFLMTTLLTVWFLVSAARKAVDGTTPYRILLFLIPLWMLLTGYLATTDFYRYSESIPPRVVAFGVLPSVIVIAIYFVAFRGFIASLPLTTLTLLHVVRIPVETVLLWLYQKGQVPVLMTFEGWNFDILSGISAPIIYWLAFRRGRVKRPLLIIWNLAALGLLINIVTIAVLSFRTPFQQLAFDQPNVGVTYLPFIWLPAIIVPIVLFAHLAALYNLLSNRSSPSKG